jgi:hypothetical protein
MDSIRDPHGLGKEKDVHGKSDGQRLRMIEGEGGSYHQGAIWEQKSISLRKEEDLMKTNTKRIMVAIGVCLGLMILIGGSWVHAQDHRALIAPIDTKPQGQTYGRWAVEWWQWALGVPLATSPLLDATGEFCSQRQVDDVWFLAGSVSTDPVVRACEIPAQKSLFFPLINNFYGAFLNDPPETRTEEFVRSAAACTEPAQISVWIDGFKVPRPLHFFTGESGSLSPLFNIQLPPDNVFGATPDVVPELVLNPSAEQGYYLFVRPLGPGQHTIRWVATGCVPGLSQDVTYNLTIINTP